MTHREFSFDELSDVDLIIDAIYKGGTFKDVRDDPLSKIMGCGNQGGFRIVGNSKTSEYKFAVLYSTLLDPDWPDNLDLENGLFIYYGDNKRPGHHLHDTPRKGNKLLRFCFQEIHSTPPRRERVPPFFVFTKGPIGRDAIFRGLVACGSPMMKPIDDLIAIWKSSKGRRFQNYKAHFTILNEPIISRAWINDLHAGNLLSENCPRTWRRWVEKGEYEALRAKPSLIYRRKSEQLPSTQRDWDIINSIYEYFKDDPFGFEHCAAKIASLMDRNIVSYDVTRPWRDGGRDAIGLYRIGTKGDNIDVDLLLRQNVSTPAWELAWDTHPD